MQSKDQKYTSIVIVKKSLTDEVGWVCRRAYALSMRFLFTLGCSI